MRRLVFFAVLVGGLLAAMAALSTGALHAPTLSAVVAQTPPVKMAWSMDPAHFAFRTAHVWAYPVAASDYEVPVTCTYLGDLDVYLWQFKAAVPDRYLKGDWILYGQGAGQVVAQRFTVQPGATLALSPVPFPKPKLTDGQSLATLTIVPPAVDPTVIVRFEMLRDGQVILSQPGSVPAASPATPHTYLLRGILVGSPKAHEIRSDSAEVTFEEGDKT